MSLPTHSFTLDVYWEDTDAGGIVYHANYLKFMERARSTWLKELGMLQRPLKELEGLSIVVADLSIQYLSAAKLEDTLTVKTQLKQARRASLMLEQSIYRSDQCITQAVVRLAIINRDGRPTAMPEAMYNLFTSN